VIRAPNVRHTSVCRVLSREAFTGTSDKLKSQAITTEGQAIDVFTAAIEWFEELGYAVGQGAESRAR